jgi:ABC-type phosphate transport system substrate-binding protein
MEAFERGTYPYVKPLYFVVKADAKVSVTEFIAFLESPAGKAILRTANVL